MSQSDSMDFTARMLKAHPPEKVPFGFGKSKIKRDPYHLSYTLRTYYLPLVV
tara:strand:+ start:169 stop:324 length:156 start_codon:yes stop_codon:yes gene_type:complete